MLLKIKHIQSKIYNNENLKSNFIITNLLKGQSLTIGNSIRRVLLSNLPGTAIIAIKIPGISSEFETLSGIREDILEIILNFKTIILKNFDAINNINKFYYGELKIQGPGIITAKCLNFSYPIKIVNPNHYIATIYNKQIINFNIIATTNFGFLGQKNLNILFPNFLLIDAIFMPIISVNYSIFDNSELNKTKNNESLLLEITTNGSISPQNGITQTTNILQNIFFNIFNELKNF